MDVDHVARVVAAGSIPGSLSGLQGVVDAGRLPLESAGHHENDGESGAISPNNSASYVTKGAERRNLPATDSVFASCLDEITDAHLCTSYGPSEIHSEPSISAAVTASTALGAGVVSGTASLGKELTDFQIGSLIADKNETGLQQLLFRHGGRVENYVQTHFRLSEEDIEEALLEGAYTVNPDCNVILREFSSGKCEWQVASGERGGCESI